MTGSAGQIERSRTPGYKRAFFDWFAAASLAALAVWCFWPRATFVEALEAWYAGTGFVSWAPAFAITAVCIYSVFAIRAVRSGYLTAKARLLLTGAAVAFLALTTPFVATFVTGFISQ